MKKIVYLFFVKLLLMSTMVLAQSEQDKALATAISGFTDIEKAKNYIDKITKNSVLNLPVGLTTKIAGDNTNYTLGIMKAKFHPNYTELQVFLKIDIPQKNPETGLPMSLFFGADNIKISNEGGIVGDAKLSLLGDVNIPIGNSWQIILSGGFNKQTGDTKDLTYAIIDCDGFKELKVTGQVEFSRNLILPVVNDVVQEVQENEPRYSNQRPKDLTKIVRGDFEFSASAWNDILVEINLPPFVLAKKQNGTNYDGNFRFLAEKAVLDFSDLRNDDDVKFPDAYRDNGLLFPTEEAWTGVYIKTIQVDLPREFKTTETAENTRLKIQSRDLLIDKYGVSIELEAKNIFPLDKGVTSKEKAWSYSLESLYVKIETNSLIKANFDGQIVLPVTKTSGDQTKDKKLGLAYKGLIAENYYGLTVTTKDTLNFDIWKADATLLPNSYVELKVVDSKFLPKAVLHGSIGISVSKSDTDATNDTNKGKNTVEFKGLTFENLALQTVSPMIQIGRMGYSGMVSFGNFPVSIGNVEVIAQDDRADLYFDLALNLMDKSEIAAKARLGIRGSLTDDGGRQRYKYKGLDVKSIEVEGTVSGLYVKGRLDMLEGDPIYGNGFNADLQVKFSGAFDVKAKAIFGRKDFRYWYFDASAKLSAGYLINGFGGGAYYKMRRTALADPAEFSPTGLTYEPHEDTGLGLKAMVSFAIGTESIFNGEAAFELQFNKHGGLDLAAIYGKGNIMASIPGLDDINNTLKKVNELKETKDSFLNLDLDINLKDVTNQLVSNFTEEYIKKSEKVIPDSKEGDGNVPMKFKAAIQFDFVNKSTHGSLEMFIDAGVVTGIGENGRAGWAVFHKDPEDWYLYIGTPDDRVGIKMGVGSVSLQTGAYFMTGSQLPGSPPPPSQVAKILRVDASQLDYMREENTLANGGGLAFGASLSFATGDLSFLMFYASFDAGIGFDIMLKKYNGVTCENTGKEIGFGGWYANGQSYAYLQGQLGIRVKVFGKRKKINIISGAAAVLMQAKLPNPVWLRGYVAGEMNILGGLIKGRFNFKVTIGEECEILNGGAIDGVKMIMDVSPQNATNDVDVFVTPQVTFAMKVNEPLEIKEDSGISHYKVLIDKFTILDENEIEVPGKIEVTTTKDRANFITTDVLAGNKNYKVRVEVSFQKLENGIYKPVIEDGVVVKEVEERTFTTGTAPNYIPLNNIEYSYPVVNQTNFLRDEYDKGYVKLIKGQDYLFEDKVWTTKAKIISDNGSQSSDLSYDLDANEIYYQFPKLKKETNYSLQIVSSSSSKGNKSGYDVNELIVSNESDNDIVMTNKMSENISKEGEIERLTYSFKSSKYATFAEKIKKITPTTYSFIKHYPDVISLVFNINKNELFDEVELIGTNYSGNKSLITVEASLDNSYYTQFVGPKLYDLLPIDQKYTIKDRNIDEYGLIPTKAISINNVYLNGIQNGMYNSIITQYFPYEYDLSLLYKYDMRDIVNQISNDYVDGNISYQSNAYQFLNTAFRLIDRGDYKILMKYTLPGNKQTTSAYQTYRF